MGMAVRPLQGAGMTVPELVMVLALIGVLVGLGFPAGLGLHHRAQLRGTIRRLALQLEQARREALGSGEPCGMSAMQTGWGRPANPDLRPCRMALALESTAAVVVESNLPGDLIATPNGLLLGAGTMVASHPQMEEQWCLVVSIPLGTTRLGRYVGASDQSIKAKHCRPDAAI
ncbi:MAG: prepilin-type cleavage/methylation domain-containing protein [Aphanocapsa feldmannii 288cV]|nr:MAG: prepilin-type cleavage/methylation domain-containing protein [Aphanocapsa feldmannii 288cV]